MEENMEWYWLNTVAVNSLKMYLLSHEKDIGLDINDFGDLRGIFHNIFGWEARTFDHLAQQQLEGEKP